MNRCIGFVVPLLTLGLVLSGCGGGGGHHGSSGAGAVSVTLDGVPGSASGPSGTVHTLVVYQSDGREYDRKTANLSSGTQRIDFKGLPAGTLRLHIGLSSAAGGAEIGAVDTFIDGSTVNVPVVVTMRQTVSSVMLASNGASVMAGSTKRLYADALTADGRYVYAAPTGWTWTSDAPAAATVDGTGLVIGIAQGSASVSATHIASGRAASTAVSVLSNGITHGKWTVMVYLNAANSLYEDALVNINQMESIANNPDVRFVFQWKQTEATGQADGQSWSGTRRYLAAYDSTSLSTVNNPIRSTLVQDLGAGVDMGSSSTLANFVNWAKAKYPADHYAVVLWSHGAGWYSTKSLVQRRLATKGISYDDETGSYLSLVDVRNALSGSHSDVLASDACLMQGAEGLLEFSGVADYVVGSEENTPEFGYPYHLVFKPIVDNGDATAATLAKGLVDGFTSYYQSYPGVTWPLQQSALDSTKAGALATALDAFGQALLNEPTSNSVVPAVRAACTRIEPLDGYFYYDLDQIATTMAARSASSAVKAAANALDAAVLASVTENGNNARGTHLKGMAIEFSRSGVFGTYATPYAKLRLSGLTHWNEFLASASANP